MLKEVRGEVLVLGDRKFLNFNRPVYLSSNGTSNPDILLDVSLVEQKFCKSPIFDVVVLDSTDNFISSLREDDYQNISNVLKSKGRLFITKIAQKYRFDLLTRLLRSQFTTEKQQQLLLEDGRRPITFDVFRYLGD